MMNKVGERLDELKRAMKKAGVAAYLIPTCDFHDSEYVSDYFKVREFFSGFTGSAGTLIVTENETGLWTDGRYFLQADEQLQGSGIRLFKMGEEDVPDIECYLAEKLGDEDVLGFDGRTVTAAQGRKLKNVIKSGRLSYKADLSEGIFKRPAFPSSPIENLPEELTGMSTSSKLAAVREKMKENHVNGFFLSKLDDIMYLMNIRGNDVEFNPVALSYMYITLEKAYIFAGDGKADIAYPAALVKPYDEVASFLRSDAVNGTVMADFNTISYLDYKLIKKHAQIINAKNPTTLMKAVKNSTETGNMKRIFLKDSLALTRFIKWVTTADCPMTEMSASDRLLKFRQEIPEFRDLSFTTIAAYGANGAIIHYEPSHEHETALQKKGLFMVDSGGQYNGATTDVTRTIVMGELTDEEKQAFTYVAVGMLRILNARFLRGCTGVNIDILAREHMWAHGIDFKHGTGHGVGYILNVHEGPQAIRWKETPDDTPFEPGMTVTDEPGIYRKDKFGVRTENVLLVEEDTKTEDGVFYRFRNLTAVPIDDRGIDYKYMTAEEITMYHDYQKGVYDLLAPLMSEEEKSWLVSYMDSKSHN